MTIDNDVATSAMVDQAGALLYSLATLFPAAVLLAIVVMFGVHTSGLAKDVAAWWGRWRHNRILIVVESPVEATALRTATAGQRKPRLWHRRSGAEYLATYSRARLFLKIAEPGDTVHDAARYLSRTRPDLVILAGICRGLHPERQRVGDILLDSALVQVHPDPAAPDGLRLDPAVEEPYYLLLARLRLQEHVKFEGFVLCHGDLPASWTLAEDLAKLDPRALAATSQRARVYATAARLEPRCTGWAAVRAVAWYGQHRTTANDHLAATNVATLIVATAKSTALNYR